MREEYKFAILITVLLFALAGPAYWYISSSKILILGLPITLVWFVFCSVLATVCLAVFNRTIDDD